MRKLLIFLSIIWLSLPGFGQQTAYEYPITPKSPQWAQLKDYSQKREVCQLPGDVLKSLSTPQLVEAILDYPLLMDLFVFRNLQTGFDNLKKNFNGVKELYVRLDWRESLRYRYEVLQKIDISKFSSIEQGDHAYKLMVLEVLLAQTEITGETDELQEKKVLRTALETTFKKKEDAAVHGDYGLVPTIWLMSRILDRAGNEEVRKIKSEDSNFKAFLADGNMVINYSISEKIINLSQKHLSQ